MYYKYVMDDILKYNILPGLFECILVNIWKYILENATF